MDANALAERPTPGLTREPGVIRRGVSVITSSLAAHLVVDLAHVLAVGWATTGVGLCASARLAGVARGIIHELCDRQHVPTLPVVARLAAAVGWQVTVDIRFTHDPPVPRPRAGASHRAFFEESGRTDLLRRLGQCDPDLLTGRASTRSLRRKRVPSPSPSDVQACAAQTISDYRTALARALAARLSDRGWSLGTLAEQSGVTRGHLHASLRAPVGPTLSILGALLPPLDLDAQVVFTCLGEPRPPQRVTVSASQLRALRLGTGPSLQVLERLDPTLRGVAPLPTDAVIRSSFRALRSRKAVCAYLEVPASWADRRLRDLGLWQKTRILAPAERATRTAQMVASLRAGASAADLARDHGVTRERVRQILAGQGIDYTEHRRTVRTEVGRLLEAAWSSAHDVEEAVGAIRQQIPAAPASLVRRLVLKHARAMRWKQRMAERLEHRLREGRRRAAIAQDIRRAQFARGMTRQELAAASGYSLALISKVLEGAEGSDVAIRRIATVAGVSVTNGEDGRIHVAESGTSHAMTR